MRKLLVEGLKLFAIGACIALGMHAVEMLFPPRAMTTQLLLCFEDSEGIAGACRYIEDFIDDEVQP